MFPVESQTQVRSNPILPLTTRLGEVRIKVTSREKALAIWRDVVGLTLIEENENKLVMGVDGQGLIVLDLGATGPVVNKALGLYHVAIHVPSRADLAQMAWRALERGVQISPTDHLVSEAIYLWDLDGNGIEITFETPWRGSYGDAEVGFYAKTVDGKPHSGREAIALDELLAELGPEPKLQMAMPSGTHIGHVHVHVSSLEDSMRFYRDGIGFGGLFIIRAFGMGDVMLDNMPHIVAFNIWAGPRAVQPPEGAAGLSWFTIIVPDQATLTGVRQRLAALDAPMHDIEGGIETRDPSGNRVHVLVE